MKRRNFINYFFGGSLAGTVIAFLYPVISFILPTKQTEAVIKKTVAAKVGELAPNTSKIFKFGTSPGILINTIEGELKAFAAICTHLTCTVVFESDTGTLLCPCHNGIFDKEGDVVSGPVPRPLDRFEVKVEEEQLYLRGV